MKRRIKIFNFILMALAAASMICLVVTPTIKLDFGYHLSSEQIAELARGNDEEKENSGIDFVKLLGEEGVNLDFSFEVRSKMLLKAFKEDARTVVEEEFVKPNVENMVNSLRDPFRQIGRATTKLMFTTYYISYFDAEIAIAQEVVGDTRDVDEVRNAGGLTNAYLEELGVRAYEKAGLGNATVTAVSNEMFDSTNEATRKFNSNGTGVTLVELDESGRGTVRDALVSMFDSMGIIKEDGESLYSFEVVADAFLVDTFEQGEHKDENVETKAARLNTVLANFIRSMLPEESYDMIIMGLKFLFIGLFIFEAIWGFYFIFTLLRTLLAKKKVYTFTGLIFWILGLVQIVLGVGLTVVIAILTNGDVLSKIAGDGGEAASKALASISFSLYTCTFIPSIILLVMVPLTIVYKVNKHKYKKQLKLEAKGAK